MVVCCGGLLCVVVGDQLSQDVCVVCTFLAPHSSFRIYCHANFSHSIYCLNDLYSFNAYHM